MNAPKMNLVDLASAASTTPRSIPIDTPFRYDVTLNGVLELFHIENFSNVSEEEAVFLFRLHFDLCTAAKKLARESSGKADRAYQAVLAVLCRENTVTH
jgi:hypothetical protein